GHLLVGDEAAELHRVVQAELSCVRLQVTLLWSAADDQETRLDGCPRREPATQERKRAEDVLMSLLPDEPARGHNQRRGGPALLRLPGGEAVGGDARRTN